MEEGVYGELHRYFYGNEFLGEILCGGGRERGKKEKNERREVNETEKETDRRLNRTEGER